MTHIDIGDINNFRKDGKNCSTGASMTHEEYTESLTKEYIGHGETIKQDILKAIQYADLHSRPIDPYKEIREAQARR